MGQTEGGKWSILNDQTAAGFLYDLGRPAVLKYKPATVDG